MFAKQLLRLISDKLAFCGKTLPTPRKGLKYVLYSKFIITFKKDNN
nr:hypothetical protein [Candidatus Phytoplasma australasiaticum]